MNRPKHTGPEVLIVTPTGKHLVPARTKLGNRHSINRQPEGYYTQKQPARFRNSSPARTKALRKERA